ncbi:hypothetical protein PFISCL1PPCAC_1284, partial [Pristionchus fissidentatus]
AATDWKNSNWECLDSPIIVMPPKNHKSKPSSIFLDLLKIVVILALIANFGCCATAETKTDEVTFEPMSCEWMQHCSKKKEGTPPLLIISSDGFAHDYLNEEDTPNILKIAECGSQAEHLIPSFPVKTFSNHYTIATGLYPSNNGVVDNRFWTTEGAEFDQTNGSFFNGEPIWNTVVKNGKVAKVMMWMGSYDSINGIAATFHHNKYSKVSSIEKLENVTDWLISDSPPDLAMVYIQDPDEAGHHYGPGTKEVRDSTKKVDRHIRYIFEKLHK